MRVNPLGIWTASPPPLPSTAPRLDCECAASPPKADVPSRERCVCGAAIGGVLVWSVGLITYMVVVA